MRKRIPFALIALLIYYKRDALNTPIIPPNPAAQIVHQTNTTPNREPNAEIINETGAISAGNQNGSTGIQDQSGANDTGTKTEATVSTGPHISISYQEITDYVDEHINEIVDNIDPIKPVNSEWRANGYGFTSANSVYVDYEDGHFSHRALLECSKSMSKKISCVGLTIFDKQGQERVAFNGVDSQKDNPIIYIRSKEYIRKR